MRQERALNESLIQSRNDIITQVKKTVWEYKKTYDQLYEDTYCDMSYVPNDIQIDSQTTLTQVSQSNKSS
jgi:hypothetical protein